MCFRTRKMEKIFALVFFFATAFVFGQNVSSVTETDETNSNEFKTHLILIGISEYKNLPKRLQLNFADDDAKFFGDYFHSIKQLESKVFLNEQASKKDTIGKEIWKTLMYEAKQGDDVIIYFAGHGDIDTLAKDGFLLLNEVQPPLTNGYDFNEALSLSMIKRYMDAAASRGVNVLFIADACHSGAVNARSANEVVTSLHNEKILSITSCQKNELSYESLEYGGHGVFTYYLVQGLMGMADENADFEVDFEELEMYVKKQVSEHTEKRQHPQFRGEDPSRILAEVNSESLEMAKKNKTKFQELSSLSKSKSIVDFSHDLNTINSRIDLFLQRTIGGKFFPDELSLVDKKTLTFGKFQLLKAHENTISDLAVSRDGMLIASCSGDGVSLINQSDSKQIIWLTKEEGFQLLDLSPDSKQVVASNGFQVKIWSSSTGKEIKQSPKIPGRITAVKFLDLNQIALGTSKGFLFLWNPETGDLAKYKIQKGGINCLESSKENLAIAGKDGVLRIFNLESGSVVKSMQLPNKSLINDLLVYNGGNNAITAHENGRIVKWDLLKGSVLRELKLGEISVDNITIDLFETVIFFTQKDGNFQVIDASTGEFLKSPQKNGLVNTFEFDPYFGNLILGRRDGKIAVQELVTIPLESSATELHSYLLNAKLEVEEENSIDGTLIFGLSAKVSDVLDKLVNGHIEGITKEQLEKALRYARYANELGKKYEVDAVRLERDVLLLEIYQLILFGDQQKLESGRKLVDRLELLIPDKSFVYNVSAVYFLKLNDIVKAKEKINQAEKYSSIWVEPSYTKGLIYAAAGDNSYAEACWKRVLKLAPNHKNTNVSLVDLLIKNNRLLEAKFFADQLKSYDTLYIIPTVLASVTNESNVEDYQLKKKNLELGKYIAGGYLVKIDESKSIGLIALEISELVNWQELQADLLNNEINGFTDWRLPTKDELKLILEPDNIFVFSQNKSFWFSSSSNNGEYANWGNQNGDQFISDKTLKSNLRGVILVRNAKVNP
jgi:WD40 repeat protein